MIKAIHQIDPHADTVIILKNFHTPFAVWNQFVDEDAEAPDPHPEPNNAPLLEETADEMALLWGSAAEEVPIAEPLLEEATAEAAVEDAPVEAAVEEVTIEEATDIEPSAQDAPVVENTVEDSVIEPSPPPVSTSEEVIHYNVSSRHLRLASPKFESQLSGENWKEGVPDENDGRYHIPAEDWDMEALLILLNVLHHRNRQVPRSVSLEMLAKIAVLIDYYDCAEAAELCTERWVEHLRKTSPIPSSFCRNLMLWMCIAWVLRLPHEFTQTTVVAMSRDDSELPTLGLPITGCVGESGNILCDNGN